MRKTFWEERYAEEHYVYGTEPNMFLVEQQHHLDACMRALAVGDGEGRNGVWLAQQGLDVHAVDIAENALRKAEALAKSRGVKLRTECVDLVEWTWPQEAYELVVAIFVHFSPRERVQIHRAMWEALLPGGVLILEAFHKDQLKYQTGGPDDSEKLYTAEMLREDFPTGEVILLEETVTNLDEGSEHMGYAAVVRLVMEKTA